MSRRQRLADHTQAFIRAAQHSPTRSLQQLCAAIGCSPRTLREQMAKRHGLAPRKYLLALRLDLARHALLTGNNPRITDVATALGFDELGRFSRSYRLRHGERPSDTLRKRAAIAATK